MKHRRGLAVWLHVATLFAWAATAAASPLGGNGMAYALPREASAGDEQLVVRFAARTSLQLGLQFNDGAPSP